MRCEEQKKKKKACNGSIASCISDDPRFPQAVLHTLEAGPVIHPASLPATFLYCTDNLTPLSRITMHFLDAVSLFSISSVNDIQDCDSVQDLYNICALHSIDHDTSLANAFNSLSSFSQSPFALYPEIQ